MACEAKQHSDSMVCKRCGLTWDVNDYDPPSCRPMAEPATDELIAEIEAAEEIGGIVNEHFLQTLEHLIERREGPFWQSAETFKALIARIREQEATIKRMDDALKPFAELADRYDPPDGDDDDMAWEATACPTVGQLRAARAARKEPT